MKYKIIILFTLFSNILVGQVNTIVDSLDNPIAMTFVNENLYVLLHGSSPNEGKIISFNISTPKTSYQIHFDKLAYPRAIIEKDSILYVGLRDDIVRIDLKEPPYRLDTIYHEQFLFPRSFIFTGENLLFAQEKSLSKIDLSSANYDKEVLFYFDDNPLSVAEYGNSILIAEGKSIHKYNPDTNSISKIISNLDYNTYSILVSGNSLYLDQSDLTFGTEIIIAFNLNELDKAPSTFCDSLGSVIALTEYQGKIYFAEQKVVFNGMPEGKIQALEKELLSTETHNDTDEIKIFPNPTNGIVNIESDKQYSYEVYNILGMKIKAESLTNQINISSEPNGIYFLIILNESEDPIKIVKIIKG